MSTDRSLSALALAFGACFVIAPILSVKVAVVGALAFPLGQPLAVIGFGLRDVIHAAHGKRAADAVVWSAFWIRAALWLVIALVLAMPGKAPPGFERVVGEGLRVALGGECALLAVRYVDSAIFERFRGGFVRRYHLSNVVSYLVALLAFVLVGFAGTGKPLGGIFLAGLLVRVAVSLVMARPFAALARWAAAGALLLLSLPAQAHGYPTLPELRASGYARALTGDGQRLEGHLSLGVGRLWLSEQLTFDRWGRDVWQSRATAGVRVWRGLSAVVQRQDVTGRARALRCGVEWRWGR